MDIMSQRLSMSLSRQLSGDEESRNIDTLLDDSSFPTVANYMADRYGMTEDDYSREEIRDSFVNTMRGFNAGNSIDVMQELNYLYNGDTDTRRAAAVEAYDLWDSLDGAFSEGTTLGQKADAVGDYGRALILDPVNVVSLGVGKLVSAGATRTGTQALKEAARRAGVAAASEAAKRGATTQAQRLASRQAAQLTMSRAFRGETTDRALNELARATATRRSRADIIGTGVADSAIAVGADAGIQEADILTGRQEEYDPVRGAISAASGAVGAGIAGGMVALRGTTSVSNTSISFARSNEMAEAAAKRLADNPSEAGKMVKPSVVKGKLEEWLTPFQEYVEQGRFLREADDPAWEVFDEDLNVAFVRGVREILEESGVPIERLDASLGQRRSGWLIDAVSDPSFPNEVYDELQEFLNKTVGKLEGKDVNLVDYLKLNAERSSAAGRQLRAQAMTKRTAELLGKKPSQLTGQEAMSGALGELEEVTVGPIREFIDKGQQSFIRMLVTHPGTTALNVLGWTQATMTQSYADLIRGTLYGGVAALNGLVGRKTTAAKYANRARLMVKLQRSKLRNLADPYSTRDEVLDYLTYRPDAQDKLFRYLAGGVDSEDVVKDLGLAPGETITKGKLSQAFDALQTVYGVSAQDMLTKTQEFAYALDKQISLKYGMTMRDFLAQDNIADILTNPKKSPFVDFAKVEGTAVEDALRNVYAKKFGPQVGESGRAGPLKFIAGVLEDARNVPIIGAMLPFGQFFNNSLAFMFDHTGVSLVHRIAVKTGRDPMELVTKAAAGWTMIGWAAHKEMANLEEGLAWHEERTSDGEVVTRIYDYPVSFWKMAGRMFAHYERDGEVPSQLTEEAFRTFSIDSVTRQLGDSAANVYEAMRMITSENPEDATRLLRDATSSAIGMYGSGFTRFLDPVNTALAFAEGENYIEPTRNIGNRGLNNALRYTDQIIDSMIGLENIPGTEGYRVERHNATTDRDMGVNPARILGIREVSPASSTQRLFNDIGKPQWMTEIRIDDEVARNVFNDYIFPYIEYRADQLLENGNWESSSVARREAMLNDIIKLARDDVKEILAATTPGSLTSRTALMVEVNGQKTRGGRVYRDVLETFGVSEKELHTLSQPQLELLLWFLKEQQGNERRILDELVGE